MGYCACYIIKMHEIRMQLQFEYEVNDMVGIDSNGMK